MAFGLSLIRFLCRPSEAPLLSAGPEKAVECWIELCASFLLVFRRSCGRGEVTLKLARFEKATPQQQPVLLLLLLLLPVDLISFGPA
jgi:hypothetical protein